MLKPVFELQTIPSRVDIFQSGELALCDINDFIKNTFQQENTYVFLWRDNGLSVGEVIDNEIRFFNNNTFIDTKHFLQIRIFDTSQELHLRKTSQGIRGRLRVDGQDADAEERKMVSVRTYLSGNLQNVDNSYGLLTEARGFKLHIPASIYKKTVAPNKVVDYKVCLTNRYYLGYTNENLQAEYVDYRYAKLSVEQIKEGASDGNSNT